MKETILILGRQPQIGLAELESLYGHETLRRIQPNVVGLALPSEAIDFTRLGGSIKLAQVLTRINTTDWQTITRKLPAIATDRLKDAPEGKLKIGISTYGFPGASVRAINAFGLSIKKSLRATGRSVRIVPNDEPQLNSAKVLHNQLTSPTGCELLVIHDTTSTLIAQTVSEQDINAYAARDQGRPKRDARVGMLPPKLAQTIINLAVGSTPPPNVVLLDPFCGTGVVLQEALLMNVASVYGTDIEPRMIDFSTINLDWLRTHHPDNTTSVNLEVGDATIHQWQPTPIVVACETYLGRPFTVFPANDVLADIRTTCNLILKKFLQNAANQLAPGSRLCLAVPAWQQKPGVYIHLPTLDHLEDLGYNRVSFKYVEPEDLIYARADQIVARELLVITKA